MRLMLAVWLAFASLAAHAVDLNLVAIMGDRAMVEVNGSKPRLLAPGQSINGVRLVSVSGGNAVFDIGGQRKSLSMDNKSFRGGDGSGPGQPPKKIILHADSGGHFYADISINGTPFRGLIDTGATALSISSAAAQQIGLDPRQGTLGRVSTAGGVRAAVKLSVNQVRFAGILLYNVETLVTEGSSPPMPLIGMTILNRFTMERDGDRLILTQRY